MQITKEHTDTQSIQPTLPLQVTNKDQSYFCPWKHTVWKVPSKTKVKQLGREKWVRNKLIFFVEENRKAHFICED